MVDVNSRLSTSIIVLLSGKIEVYRDGLSEKIITPKEKLIAIASDTDIHMDDVKVIPKEDFKALADLIEKEEELKI